jgi:hypothetical protein
MPDAQMMMPWRAPEPKLLPAAPEEFVPLAVALRASEQQRVVQALQQGFHELATEFVWKRALSRLKQTLSNLGMQFVGEMLGRGDITENSQANAVLTDWDAIRLAENLGVINTFGALRLRHAFELLSHLSQMPEGEEQEELDRNEAITVIRFCVKYILSEQDFGVAVDFSRLRNRLVSETLTKDDLQLQNLLGSPPFFLKTALRVLLATIRTEHGARLEHSLSNFNLVLPDMWPRVAEEDRWAVGTTYAEMANEGRTDLLNTLRRALMKVSGFDYVPETLRSNTFKQAAKNVITAHFSMNNFHLEYPATLSLSKLGTVIPKPAVIESIQAYLCVYLGNRYGHSFQAAPLAEGELKKISSDRWSYYLTKVFANDDVILGELMNAQPSVRFCALIRDLDPGLEDDRSADSSQILAAARGNRSPVVSQLAGARWHRLRGSTS